MQILVWNPQDQNKNKDSIKMCLRETERWFWNQIILKRPVKVSCQYITNYQMWTNVMRIKRIAQSEVDRSVGSFECFQFFFEYMICAKIL